jgi:hypothetical protein
MSTETAPEVVTTRHTGPRTDELPMAFTTWEFARGALIAYGLFLGFTAVVWIWTLIGVIVALYYVAPFGFASLILVGAPLAYLTGMLLRRETRTAVHLFWHGLVGLVAGGAGVVFALCIIGPGSSFTAPHVPDLSLFDGVWGIALVEALLTVGAAMAGWRITSKRALRG